MHSRHRAQEPVVRDPSSYMKSVVSLLRVVTALPEKHKGWMMAQINRLSGEQFRLLLRLAHALFGAFYQRARITKGLRATLQFFDLLYIINCESRKV